MKNEMMRTQYQGMDEVHHESQSIEVMDLSTTITKNVMTTIHQRMTDAIKHVSSKTIIFELVEV